MFDTAWIIVNHSTTLGTVVQDEMLSESPLGNRLGNLTAAIYSIRNLHLKVLRNPPPEVAIWCNKITGFFLQSTWCTYNVIKHVYYYLRAPRICIQCMVVFYCRCHILMVVGQVAEREVPKTRHTPCDFRRHDDRRLSRRRTTIVEWAAHTMRRSSNDLHTPRDGSWLHTRRPTTVEADSEPGGYFFYQEEEEEEEKTLFNNLTLVLGPIYSYNFNIVHYVQLSGNRMTVGLRRLPAIPNCKLYISEQIMTSGAGILKKNHILNKENCVNNNTNSIRSCLLASFFSHSATMAVLSKHAIFCIAAYALIRRRRDFCDNRIVKLYLDILFQLDFFYLIIFLVF